MANELGETIGKLIQDKEDMKQSWSPHGTTPLQLILEDEGIKITQVDLKITKKDFSASNSFILGHATNGFLGTANGLGGGQIVLGSDGNEVTTTLTQRRYTWRSESNLNAGNLGGRMSSDGNKLSLK